MKTEEDVVDDGNKKREAEYLCPCTFFFFVDFVSIQIFLWIIKKKKNLKELNANTLDMHFRLTQRVDLESSSWIDPGKTKNCLG
jgi:hypothetical protein